MAPQPHTISGRVQESNGRPAIGARIYFLNAPVAVADMAIITDQQGRFTLPAPTPGTYEVGCTFDGFAPVTVKVDVVDKDAQVEIKVQR